ncbi:hypothetical protein [Agaribacterium sp. ZY112]|uniref:hypothetical protein n=1 Tax=Agaribacterium sp. ZY112 TaxID=3233574 RepID=UPI003523D689
MSKALRQYLKNYAETEHKLCLALPITVREHVVVIPACHEHLHFVERLSQHPQAEALLLILVLNEHQQSPRQFVEQNQVFKKALLAQAQLIGCQEHVSLLSFQSLQILLIERCAERALPPKQGVGLARKIGADCATALIDQGSVLSPWIYSSDADAQLPDNYFSLTKNRTEQQSASAWTFNFKHIGGEADVAKATRLYEYGLHKWRIQLERAGSLYAYHSLGSALAFNYQAYAQVRGFPKRSAAEDFYLLNKLAKLQGIAYAEDICINIEARLSERVPFGTGPAVAQICEQQRLGEAFTWYNPKIFIELKKVLSLHNALFAEGINAIHTLEKSSQTALKEAGIESFLAQRSKQNDSPSSFARHFQHWFDAFQTLKFIRRLQTSTYPPTKVEAVL